MSLPGNISNLARFKAPPSGTSPVGTTGIAATQVPYGSGANQIKGSATLTFVEADSLKIGMAVTGGIQIYNTADQTTNYERMDMLFLANQAIIRTAIGGTGTNRILKIQSNFGSIAMGVGVTPGITYSVNSNALSTMTSHLFTAGSTATSGTIVGISIAPTYNQASGNAANTDFLINRTQTAVGSGAQLLIDAQVGTVSQFSVSNQGGISVKVNANGRAGTFVLVAGTVTVANTSVTANSVIEFTVKTVGGTIGIAPQVVSTVVGTSFTVTGAGTNTSTYNYIIKEIIP